MPNVKALLSGLPLSKQLFMLYEVGGGLSPIQTINFNNSYSIYYYALTYF